MQQVLSARPKLAAATPAVRWLRIAGRVFAAISTSLFLQGCGGATADFADIDRLIETTMPEDKIPGAAIVIIRDGGVVYARGYGVADREHQIAATAQTVWPIASMSKVFTAIGAMQLVNDGVIGLDDDVNARLESAEVQNTFPEPIRVVDLLTHAAGLDEIPGRVVESADDMKDWGAFIAANLVRYRPAGEATAYSTYGVALLGLIIQDASGTRYEDFLLSRVFRPLGMSRAWVMDQPGDEKGLAAPYAFDDGAVTRVGFEWYLSPPASSIVMSAEDMGRFLSDLTSRSPKILPRRTLDEMMRTQRTNHPAVPGFGYGFQIEDYGGATVAIHGGDIGGFGGLLAIVPSRGDAIFIAHHGEGGALRYTILNAWLKQVLPDAKPATPPDPPLEVDLAPYLGRYRAPFACHTCGDTPRNRAYDFEVAVEGGRLTMWGARFTPLGEDAFLRDDGLARIAFIRDADSRVIAVSGGSFRGGERIDDR